MGSISKLINLFGSVKSADHINDAWDADAYLLDDDAIASEFDSLPAMFVDAQSHSALAQYNWVTLPSYAPIASCAYMLSTRRI